MNNTALRRIKKEYDMIQNDLPDNFVAGPIKDDLFTWHFTIRGAEDSEFEGGVYHGVIKLPTSYPLKPPNIMFLNPSGRFDVNVDVCLSVTKYHKEEWQAAWTIRTMLEAIIAFFPITEEHDAIGAIDYPIETRKKIAIQSRKWKCDICGPIVDLFLEKKHKIIIPNTESNGNIESSAGDSKSDNSDRVDSLPTKKSSSKSKKIELDRKSHLSQIEGVIFEDVNEDIENEEDIEINTKFHQTKPNLNLLNEEKDLNKTDMMKTKKTEPIKNELRSDVIKYESKAEYQSSTILKRSHSDNSNSHTDFSEYLRNIRRTQFEETKVEPSTEEPEINFKNRQPTEVITGNIQDQKEPQRIEIQNEPLQKQQTAQLNKQQFSQLRESTVEEMEFYDVLSTIKNHKSKTPEEILKEMNSEEDSLKKKKEPEIRDVIDKILEKQSKLNRSTDKQDLLKIIEILTGQDEIGKLIERKNNMQKYFTRRSYKDAKSNRLKIINFVTSLLIFGVFGVYIYLRHYA